jgi:hypothetical protein
MLGCLISVFSRVALLYFWLATPLVNRAFQGNILLPLLGILFLPLTALAYVLVYTPGVGVTGWNWLWVVLAFFIDLASHSSGVYSNRRRISGYTASRR